MQWVFPASSHYTDRVTGERRRHHLHESVLQKAVREARLKAGSRNRLAHTRFAILLRPTYWTMATTSARFRNFWGTRTSRLR